MKHVTLLNCAAAAILIGSGTALIARTPLAPVKYTNDGSVPLPDHAKWVFIGSGLFNSPQAGQNPRFSNVFVEPSAYDEYMRTGTWPDRTVIFSEKRASIATQPITANSGWGQTGEALGAELEIKDQSKGGWLYYEAAAGEKVGKPVADQKACTACHSEHAAVDNVFVQFYPPLMDAARKHGTYRNATH